MSISHIDQGGGRGVPSKTNVLKKLAALLAGMAVAFAGFFMPNLASAEGAAGETAARSTDPVVTAEITNAPSAPDKKWRFGERITFKVKIKNGSESVRVEPYTSAPDTNIGSTLSSCKWNLSPHQAEVSCSGAYTITPHDAGTFTPKITYKKCANQSCTNGNITKLPAVELEPQQIEPPVAVGFEVTNPDDAPWELNDVIKYRVTVKNTSSAARSYKGMESNLDNFDCRWSSIGKDEVKTDCIRNHTISEADVTARSFTPHAKFRVYSGTGYPESYYTLSTNFTGDPLPVSASTVQYANVLEANKAFNTENAPGELQKLKQKMQDKADTGVRWIFAGDSITQGVMHTEGLRHYTEYFNEALHTAADQGLGRPHDRVVNSGNSGATTRILKDDAKRQALIDKKKPDVVFIAYGMNDGRSNTVPVNEYKQTLQSAIQKVKDLDAIPILQTTNYTINESNDNNLNAYYQAVRDLAAEQHVLLIDFSKRWNEMLDDSIHTKEELLGDNNLHPSKVGHLEWAQYILRVLEMDNAAGVLGFTNPQRPLNNANPDVSLPREDQGCESGLSPVVVSGATPVVTKTVDAEFHGSDTQSLEDTDVSKISSLSQYTFVARVKADANGGGTIFSISDKNSNNVVAMRIEKRDGDNKGKAQISGPQLNLYWTRGSVITDGTWHTVAMAVNMSSKSATIYVDGHSAGNISLGSYNLDLSNIHANAATIGGVNGTEKDPFTGSIGYVQVFDKTLSSAQLAEATSNCHPSIGLASYINNSKPNTWLFLGGVSTAGASDNLAAKNYVEIFEETMRWDYSTDNEMRRMKIVVNDGQAGFKSDDLKNRYNELTKDPSKMGDIVYILPDPVVSGEKREEVDTFKANIKALAEKIRKDSHEAILVTPASVDDKAAPFAEAMRDIAQSVAGTKLIDLTAYLKGAQAKDPDVSNPVKAGSWFGSDGIATDAGQLAIARYLLKVSGMPMVQSASTAARMYQLEYDASEAALPPSPTLESTITVRNPQTFSLGDRIEFNITFKNTSGKDRSFASGATNLSGAETCKWRAAANNDLLSCNVAYHVVTQDDVDAGKFIPRLTWMMYDTTEYPSSPAPAAQPETVGSPVTITPPTLAVRNFALAADSPAAPYAAGDVIKIDLEIENTGMSAINLEPKASESTVTFPEDNSCAASDLQPGARKSCVVTYTVREQDLTYGYVTLNAAVAGKRGNTEVQKVKPELYSVPTPGVFEKAKSFKAPDANPAAEPTSTGTMTMLAQGGSGFGNRIPAIAVASNGDILASYDYRPSRGKGNNSDSPRENWIMQRRSTDGGATWKSETVIAMGKLGSYGYSDPSYVVDHETGTIFNFHVYSQESGVFANDPEYLYKSDGSIDEAHDHTMNFGLSVSKDNGYTWEQHVITDQVLRDKAHDLKSCFATSGAGTQKMQNPYKGRLLQQAACVKKNGDVVALTLYSDDHGATWTSGAMTNTTPNGLNLKFDENKVVELGNGDLLLNSRTPTGSAHGYRIVAISKDGGQTWQDYKVENQLQDGTNNAQIIRAFPNAKPNTLRSQVLLFSNTPAGDRKVGYMWISYDNGKTWKKGSKIPSSGTGYTTMAVQPDGSIGLLLEPGTWSNIAYMNFNLPWVDPDHDVDSELKAKTNVANQSGTDGSPIEIPLSVLFDRNDPKLEDTVEVTGLPEGFSLALNDAGTALIGTPNAGNTAEQTIPVTVTLTEADDGTGYDRTATATFNLVLAANSDPTDPPVVDPDDPKPPVDPKDPPVVDPKDPSSGKKVSVKETPATGSDLAIAGLTALVLLGAGTAGLALRRRHS